MMQMVIEYYVSNNTNIDDINNLIIIYKCIYAHIHTTRTYFFQI